MSSARSDDVLAVWCWTGAQLPVLFLCVKRAHHNRRRVRFSTEIERTMCPSEAWEELCIFHEVRHFSPPPRTRPQPKPPSYIAPLLLCPFLPSSPCNPFLTRRPERCYRNMSHYVASRLETLVQHRLPLAAKPRAPMCSAPLFRLISPPALSTRPHSPADAVPASPQEESTPRPLRLLLPQPSRGATCFLPRAGPCRIFVQVPPSQGGFPSSP